MKNVLPGQFQTVVAVLASDCAKKRFFFCLIREQQTLESSRVFLHTKYISAIRELKNHDEVHDDNFC